MKTNILSRTNLSLVLAALAVIPFLTLGTAHGAAVTVTDIETAGLGFFTDNTDNVDINEVDSSLQILDLDIEPTNFKATASAIGFNFDWAFDTISFTIGAPAGYVITGIKYKEAGTRNQTGWSSTIAIGGLTVDGVFEKFSTGLMSDSTTNGTWETGTTSDLSNDPKNTVDVSIFNLIAAMAIFSDATIEKTDATLDVTMAAIPIPSAALLLASGLFGVIAWRRRSTKS